MRLTRRGYVVLGVVLLGVGLAATFGPRALNAVVLPAAVALAAAVFQVWRADVPRVTRQTPPDDFPGESGDVTLSLDAPQSYPATVTDDLPYGVEGDSRTDTVVGDGRPVTYRVTYRERGEHELGPAVVVACDILGLAERELVTEGTDSVLVFPRVRPLSGAAHTALYRLYAPEVTNRREEFDGLREYVRGDSLRDVHWKSSAKRDDLIVKEFVAESDAESVSVSVGGTRSAADAMAEAGATLAVALVAAGVPVTLSTPSGVVEAAAGDRRSLLKHLALAEGGRVPDDGADVVVEASEAAVSVRFADRETTFEALVDGRRPSRSPTESTGATRPASGGASA
jgi:uncharacterized protein (DUF58 family)